MNGVLVDILWRSLRGSLARRARLLRQPRYLVAFLASAAWFAFTFRQGWGGMGRGRGGAPFGSALPAGAGLGPGDAAADVMGLIVWLAALGLAAATTLLWAFGSAKPALQLSEADINLLLPAPLPRRTIIELSIWRQQAGLLTASLVLTIFRGYGPPGVRLLRLVTTWAVLLLIGLHTRGVRLWKARLRELPPAAARWRVALAVAIGVAYWTAVGHGLAVALHGVHLVQLAPRGQPFDTAALRAALRQLVAAPPAVLTILLAPMRWVALAFIVRGGQLSGLTAAGAGAGGGTQWPLAACFLALMVVAHYEWVVRSRARFEDAAVERARRQAERRTRQRALPAPAARDRRREPFALAPAGMPELAIYWKNLMAARRTPLRRRAAIAALPGVAIWVLARTFPAPLPYLLPAAFGGFVLLVVPPLVAGANQRHDLRTDLLHLEVLRPWPLRGWRLVAGELLAPATSVLGLTLTGFALVVGSLLATGGRMPAGAPDDLARLGERLAGAAGGGGGGFVPAIASLALGLLLIGIPITLLSLAFHNLGVLVLPGWARLGSERRAGSALAGARLLVMLANLVVLAVGLIPAALLVAAAALLARWWGLAPALWQLLPLALLGALPLLAEAALLVRVAGALWDRLDPSQEILNPED